MGVPGSLVRSREFLSRQDISESAIGKLVTKAGPGLYMLPHSQRTDSISSPAVNVAILTAPLGSQAAMKLIVLIVLMNRGMWAQEVLGRAWRGCWEVEDIATYSLSLPVMTREVSFGDGDWGGMVLGIEEYNGGLLASIGEMLALGRISPPY